MIEVNEQFHVPADPDAVWAVVREPHQVAACIPGAVLEDEHEDGTYSGSILVQFGPARVTFRATVNFVIDEVGRIGRVEGRGKDTAGGTRANMAFSFAVAPDEGGTQVAGQGEVEVKGKLAGMIEAGASIVVKRMLGEFSDRLMARCAGPEAAAKSDAGPRPGLTRRLAHGIGLRRVGPGEH